MATATPLKEEKNEDNFELELNRVRERIGSVFDELVECLESQKRDLYDSNKGIEQLRRNVVYLFICGVNQESKQSS